MRPKDLMYGKVKFLLKKGIEKSNLEKAKLIHRSKISKLVKRNPKLTSAKSRIYKKEIDDYWNSQFGYKIKPDWHFAYSSVNGLIDPKYIPEDIFYTNVLPKLNRMELVPAYKDKNNYNIFLEGYSEPKTIIKNINSYYFDDKSNEITMNDAKEILKNFEGEFVIKPSLDSGGGNDVKIGFVNNRKIYINKREFSFEDLEKYFDRDFIVQNKIFQHQFLNEIYPNSLNTVRLITLRIGEEIIVISGVVRFGNGGSKVDNQAFGGLSCGINEHGELNNHAIDKYGYIYLEHPYTKINFADFKSLPNFKEIKSLVKSLHLQLKYFDLVSWDLAIDWNGKPILIELNLGDQEINFHQFNNGPLFKNYTEAVLNRK